MTKKNKDEFVKLREKIAEELKIDTSQILDFSEEELTAGVDEICVFRKKLGLFVIYKK